jgi:hypothetical protein
MYDKVSQEVRKSYDVTINGRNTKSEFIKRKNLPKKGLGIDFTIASYRGNQIWFSPVIRRSFL